MNKFFKVKFSFFLTSILTFILLIFNQYLYSKINNESFSFLPIIFGLFLYILLEIIMNFILKEKLYVIRLFFVFSLLIMFFINSGLFFLGEAPFLFNDDQNYNFYGRGGALWTPLLFSGGFYYIVIRFIYDLFGPYTINGRILNIFLFILSGLLGTKIFSFVEKQKYYQFIILLLFLPELLYFSLFEFKDNIFVFLLFAIVFLAHLSYYSSKKMTIFLFIIAFGLSYIASWFRVGISYIFFVFAFLPNLFKKNEYIKINYFLVSLYLMIVGFSIFFFKDFKFLGILGDKIESYLFMASEMSNSGYMSNFIIQELKDIIILPISFILVPYPIVFSFTDDSFLMFLFSVVRFFTLIIYFNFIINLIFGMKLLKSDLISIFIPLVTILTVLTILNPGHLRHSIFILPFIVMINVKNEQKIKKSYEFSFIITLLFYSIYYFLKLGVF